MEISAVLQRHETALMALPNVQGVGIGEKNGQPAIKIFVDRKVPESSLRQDERIPADVEGVPTDVEEVGTITAQGAGIQGEDR